MASSGFIMSELGCSNRLRTGSLALPRSDRHYLTHTPAAHRVIGNPPAVSVPTHFAKVVLGVGKPNPNASSSLKAVQGTNEPQLTPRGAAGNLIGEKWVGLGAFVIPNAVVANQTPLKSFVVPGVYRHYSLIASTMFRLPATDLFNSRSPINNSRSSRTSIRIEPLPADCQVNCKTALQPRRLQHHRQGLFRCQQEAATAQSERASWSGRLVIR